MYIPIGPNKKQLYKIIICLLLLLYLIFLGMYKPKALTYEWNPRNVYSGVGGNYTNVNGTKTAGDGDFQPYDMDSYVMQAYSTGMIAEYNLPNGTGTLAFAIGLKGQQAGQLVTNLPSARVLFNGGTQVAYCNSNLNTVYGDMVVINYFCPGYYKGDNSYNDLRLSFDMELSTFMKVGLSKSVSIYSEGTDLSSINNGISNIQNSTNDIKNNLNDSSIDSSSANNFTNNSAFQDSNGLDAIIKAPLNFIQSLTSSTCSSISLTIPYIDANVSLPCMSTIYNKALGQQLVNLIALVINGVVLYRYCLKILQIIKDAKNPNKDGLEVLDL